MLKIVQPILKHALKIEPPQKILCIGHGLDSLLHEFLHQHPTCHVKQLDSIKAHDVSKIDSIYDLTIITNTLEHLEKSKAVHLLSGLRDLHSRKIIVVVPIGEKWENLKSHWQNTDFISLGFVLLTHFEVNQCPLHIYAFDIMHYKTTPDWLNNKNWANPELWDKYWW